MTFSREGIFMNNLFKMITVLCILLIGMNLDSVVEAQDRVGFSVQAELPDNQRNEDLSYFDLRINPEEEQKLNVTIFNHENEELTIHGDIFNATTSSNGNIVYEESEVDSSLTDPVTELLVLDEDEWTIPAGESITITATLNTPEEPFDGIKLGGLYFEKALETGTEEEGVNIQNQYAYTIGVQLSENDTEISPDLTLNSMVPDLVNYRTAVIANIQNKTSVIAENLTVNAEVFEGDETTPIREVEQEGMRMAPNSTMPFIIHWNNERLEAGDYRLKMTVTDGEQEWEWQEMFQISEEDEMINEEAVELVTTDDTQNINIWFLAGLAVLIVIILTLVFYIRKLKQENKS